jgi:hypothetical protein
MRWTGVVAALAVFVLMTPAMVSAQAAPIGAWCGGSYGAEGTNFAPCVGVQIEVQAAGQVSGTQPQIAPTLPQYPAGQVTFENGQAIFNKQVLNLNYSPPRDRSHEVQSGGE